MQDNDLVENNNNQMSKVNGIASDLWFLARFQFTAFVKTPLIS